MGQVSSSTAFVGTGNRAAAQSYKPCHKFADSDMIGPGVRIAFYLLYAAAAAALLTSQTHWLRTIRVGLAILSMSLFAALCIVSASSSASVTLLFLNWDMVIALTLGHIFLTDLFLRGGALYLILVHRPLHAGRDAHDRRALRSASYFLYPFPSTPASMSSSDHLVGLLDAATAVYAVDLAGRDSTDSTAATTSLHHELVSFAAVSSFFSAQVDDPIPALSPEHYLAPSFGVVAVGLNLDSFRDAVINAASSAGAAPSVAIQLDDAARAAARRTRADAVLRTTVSDLQSELQAYDPLDRVAIAVTCISWAAYQLARPWLYWIAIDTGRKLGCDVQIRWFFIANSIYNHSFVIWLRLWGVLLVFLALPVLGYGTYILFANILATDRWGQPWSQHAAANDADQISHVSASADPETETFSQHILIDGDSNYRDVSDKSGSCAKSSPRRYRKRKAYYVLAAVLIYRLIVTLGAVEGSLRLNELDWSAPPFSSPAQLIAFIMALLITAPIFWECLVISPLRWCRSRRSSLRRSHEEGGTVEATEPAS